MTNTSGTASRLAAIPNLQVSIEPPLARYTRFAIGGPAGLVADAASEEAFIAALTALRERGDLYTVIGGGSNLIVSDEGFPGVVLRYVANAISHDGMCVHVESGAVLQDLVDYTGARGMKGLETLAGIPGWVGAAVYGNAGAYGHSISERVSRVRFFDGAGIREFDNAQCRFRYRESVFKENKDWILFTTDLAMLPGDAAELQRTAAEIVATRNAKFPPTMKCAGSIFKNFHFDALPPEVAAQVPPNKILGGKVPAGYFLEQVGAKGYRHGGIEIAPYHGNLIYNTGDGTAAELLHVIAELKRRVRNRYGIDLEEEVQYVGFHGGRSTI